MSVRAAGRTARAYPGELGWTAANTAPVTIGSHPDSDWYQGSLDEATIAIGS